MRKPNEDSHERRWGLPILTRRRQENPEIHYDAVNQDEMSSELNLAWDELARGDFSSATEHAEYVIRSAGKGSNLSVNAQLILLKMKTRQGLFTGLVDELEDLFRDNPKVTSSTQAIIGNEIVRACQRSGNNGFGAQRGEELIREYSNQWPDVEVVELLCQVAGCHFLRGDADRAEELITQALDLAEKSKSPKSIAQSYWQLSSVSADKGNMPISLSQNEEARRWARVAEMHRILPVLNANAASILLEMSNQDLPYIHELAESAYLELTAQNDPAAASYACVSLAEVELRQSNFDGALVYVDKGLSELPPEIPGPRTSLYIQKAKILARIGDYAQSERQAEIAVEIMKSMEPSRYLATSWAHVARVFVEIGFAERGVYAYEQALQMTGVVREEPEVEVRRVKQKQR